jgi:hypothetical protein
MRRRYAAGILVILGLAVLTARADDFWVKKDWRTWSKAECKKMLEESPLSKRFLVDNNSSNSQLPYANGHPSNSPGFGLANPGAGEVTYFIQLLSAPPVREAVIRRQQIDQKYDKMSNAEKNAFDAKMEQQMGGIKGDVIAFRVVFAADKPALGDTVIAYWQSLPPNTVPANFYLVTEKGVKVPPLAFIFVKGADTYFDVTFPRNAGPQPVIEADAKSMKLQFSNPAVDEYPEKSVTVEYNFDKMMWNGKLAY